MNIYTSNTENKSVAAADHAQKQNAEGQAPVMRRENRTGMPDSLKAGIESLSGYSMDDVRVHYNSAQPAQLQAHAYAQGNEIHIANGQERHLPHEAWHVVQQKQGRVKPTAQLKGKLPVNDDAGLEKEADVMGSLAQRQGARAENPIIQPKSFAQNISSSAPIQMLREVSLPEQDYGSGVSHQAYNRRIIDKVHPNMNIATFHFVKRPNLDGEQEDDHAFSETEVSTGVGDYVVVSNKTQAEKKINTSHSEHQFIHSDDGLQKLRNEEQFPQKYVIDWVYTERPACPDVWYGHKHIADGCHTELRHIENIQKRRFWDVGPDGHLPYGDREDLEITVFSTFSNATEIKNAVYFTHIRREAFHVLYGKLLDLYQTHYSNTGEQDEYNLDVYEHEIPQQARIVANELPTWSDYLLNRNEAGQNLFAELLKEESDNILQHEREKLYSKQHAEAIVEDDEAIVDDDEYL